MSNFPGNRITFKHQNVQSCGHWRLRSFQPTTPRLPSPGGRGPLRPAPPAAPGRALPLPGPSGLGPGSSPPGAGILTVLLADTPPGTIARSRAGNPSLRGTERREVTGSGCFREGCGLSSCRSEGRSTVRVPSFPSLGHERGARTHNASSPRTWSNACRWPTDGLVWVRGHCSPWRASACWPQFCVGTDSLWAAHKPGAGPASGAGRLEAGATAGSTGERFSRADSHYLASSSHRLHPQGCPPPARGLPRWLVGGP